VNNSGIHEVVEMTMQLCAYKQGVTRAGLMWDDSMIHGQHNAIVLLAPLPSKLVQLNSMSDLRCHTAQHQG
jgi:hypothetical protein